jgi:hypothetical protein
MVVLSSWADLGYGKIGARNEGNPQQTAVARQIATLFAQRVNFETKDDSTSVWIVILAVYEPAQRLTPSGLKPSSMWRSLHRRRPIPPPAHLPAGADRGTRINLKVVRDA